MRCADLQRAGTSHVEVEMGSIGMFCANLQRSVENGRVFKVLGVTRVVKERSYVRQSHIIRAKSLGLCERDSGVGHPHDVMHVVGGVV